MGMAASQARYLSLAARQVNIEYEGQQINQSRTALANQSANLFNQMLGLQVPTPPSTQDFSKTQYSFTDGINASVINKWEQLANPDDEGYNYVVEYYYNANVYTGFQKKMNDPQIQFAITVPLSGDYSVQRAEVTKIKEAQDARDAAQKDYDDAVAEYQAMQTKAAKLATYRDLETLNDKCKYTNHVTDTTTGKNQYEIYDKDSPVIGTDNPVYIYKSYNSLKKEAEAENNINNEKFYIDADGKLTTTATTAAEENTKIDADNKVWIDADGKYQQGPAFPVGVKYTDVTGKTVYKAQDSSGKDYYTTDSSAPNATYAIIAADSSSEYFVELCRALETWNADGISNDNKNNIYYCTTPTAEAPAKTIAYKDDLDNLKGAKTSSLLSTLPIYNVSGQNTEEYATINGMSTLLSELKEAAAEKLNTLKAAEAKVETLNVATYVGNSKLTSLNTLSQEEFAEIKQIITDMNKNGVTCQFLNCFDSALSIDADHYTGGIYKFERDGVTYYTTYFDLADTAMASTFKNDIDNQPKLNYYNATYVKEDVKKVDKAILDTDSTGRFKSVRFKEDGAEYKLNVETVTDDVAYQDAMNQYYYKTAEYDKMIQDLNAKTSIIQQEDRTLELKLKQLDTERTALSNEMEAVQKVVKDNLEKSFKAFGG